MAFQRSYSKVWWGSDNSMPSFTSGMNAGSSFTSGGYYYSSYHSQASVAQQQEDEETQPFGGSGYHSLDYNSLRMFSGNLSRIQEVDDEQQQQQQQQQQQNQHHHQQQQQQMNVSKLSWEKHDSPGSLRSQDSGFSDNDESHSTRSLGGRSSKTASPSTKSNSSRKSTDSPVSTHTISTPPTVIRRVGRSEFYSPLVNVSRRISFSGSPSSRMGASGERENVEMKVTDNVTEDDDVEDDGSTLLAQLDSIQLLNSTPKKHAYDIDVDSNGAFEATADKTKVKSKVKRRRRIIRTPTKPLATPSKRRTMPKEVGDYIDDENDELGKTNASNNDADADADADVDVDADDKDNSESSFDELEQEIAELRQQTRAGVPEYNNETVYLGACTPMYQSYNNETVLLGQLPEDTNNNNTLKSEDILLSTFHQNHHIQYPRQQPQQQQQQRYTSTPKAEKQHKKSSKRTPASNEMDFLIFEPLTSTYANPLLNGHTPALQHWLYELHSSYEQEVMSTLQTKSIVQEAFKNLTITTNTVAKLIRQLQQRALYMQSDFERMERILTNNDSNGNSNNTTRNVINPLYDALSCAEQLLANIGEFTRVLERRSVFFSESRVERKKYEDNLDQIKLITKDTRYSIERQHYINLESLLDDIQVLKRYLLIALRQVFERMVRIIVQSIEQSRCDLMLRANINMVATLTNIDYEGFASLTDAFVQNEAVRALLIVCLEHKLSSVRALALRALATICCAPAAIAQLSACDGIEILRDILQVPMQDINNKRGAMERREAVSLLTQLTAAWHGPDHHVNGLKDCVESIVAGLTQLVGESTSCAQTLLLCAAALNNLSRIEVTSHYSIMSNETVFKLIETVKTKDHSHSEHEPAGISIFLYEQIVAMLHNMSLNKKCHSHLANGCIINFITSVYEMEFYKGYDSRAESDAQRRTIKTILYTLTRLVQDSNGLAFELMQQQQQQQHLPSLFFKLTNTSQSDCNEKNHIKSRYEGCQQFDRDIELLVRQLQLAQKHSQKQQQQQQEQQQEQQCQYNVHTNHDSLAVGNIVEDNEVFGASTITTENGMKFNLTKHESFV